MDKILPLLTHPLALTGYIAFLVIGILRAILKAGLLSRASKEATAPFLTQVIKYGFYLAIISVIFGYTIEAYKIYVKSNSKEVSEAIIAGVVVDDNSNNSISGANLNVVGHGVYSVTGSTGNFRLVMQSTIRPSVLRVRVEKSGYTAADYDVMPPVYDLIIRLKRGSS